MTGTCSQKRHECQTLGLSTVEKAMVMQGMQGTVCSEENLATEHWRPGIRVLAELPLKQLPQ
jgi:hypothetical protein